LQVIAQVTRLPRRSTWSTTLLEQQTLFDPSYEVREAAGA